MSVVIGGCNRVQGVEEARDFLITWAYHRPREQYFGPIGRFVWCQLSKPYGYVFQRSGCYETIIIIKSNQLVSFTYKCCSFIALTHNPLFGNWLQIYMRGNVISLHSHIFINTCVHIMPENICDYQVFIFLFYTKYKIYKLFFFQRFKFTN